MLAREVLRLRGSIASREASWDVMPDLYFYRDPEAEENKGDAIEEKTEEAATAEAAFAGGDWEVCSPDISTLQVMSNILFRLLVRLALPSLAPLLLLLLLQVAIGPLLVLLMTGPPPLPQLLENGELSPSHLSNGRLSSNSCVLPSSSRNDTWMGCIAGWENLWRNGHLVCAL